MSGPTPESIAASGTEHSQQVALFAWAALNVDRFPCLRWMHAIPNGGSRGDGTARGRAIAGGNLKAEGVRSGIFDVFLPFAARECHGLYIEFKKPDLKHDVHPLNGTSGDQREFMKYGQSAGYAMVVCYTLAEARIAIEQYLHGAY